MNRRLTRLRIASAAALGLVAACWACGSGGGTADVPPAGGALVVLTPDGAAPPRLAVAVTREDGAVEILACGGDGDTPPCHATGLPVEDPDGISELVVKAPGFRTRALDAAAIRGEDGRLAVEVVPLPAPTVTADYRTGLAPDEGLETLLALSWPADTELGSVHAIKFLITGLGPDAAGPPALYLQDTLHHPLHADFARDVLGLALTPLEFAAATYQGVERTMMAGTLLHYPGVHADAATWGGPLDAPLAVTFFPSDDLTPQQALLAFSVLEERLCGLPVAGAVGRLAYLPAGSVQEEQILEQVDVFRRWGAPWVLHRELAGGVGIQLLNPGVAYGTLRRLTPEELETVVVSWMDLLLLPRLPVTLPVVGGTITEELQTPLSHVNVAARNRGTPNMALPGASTDPRVAPYIGAFVRLEVDGAGFELREATLAEAEEYWASHVSPPFVPEADDAVAGLPGFDDLGFDHWTSVGVKAANLAELWHLLPGNAPAGFGIPFSYYVAHMTASQATPGRCHDARVDCVEEGRDPALCDAAEAWCKDAGVDAPDLWSYAEALLADPDIRGDTVLREAALDGLVHLISHAPVDAAFGAALDARVAEIFGDAKVRLRSSTNAEDLPGFSGAGLYRSVSAWAKGADSASSRVRKVWASAWSFRAVEERAWWNIDHMAVRMGVAVNGAFVDEAANGVVVTRNLADPTVDGIYVNVQLGEVSVTNPTEGALPEIFTMLQGPGGVIQVVRTAWSSLSPGAPILDDAEIADLYWTAHEIHQHFLPLYESAAGVQAMDMEFKIHGPERTLYIKQARPYVTSGAW